MRWMDRWSCMRQWMYPAVFRIDGGSATAWSRKAADVLAALELPGDGPSPDEPPPPPPSPGIPDDLAVCLGNAHFWIARQVRQMESEGLESKETRMIKRYLQRLDKAMGDNDIRCIDVEGQVVDEGRRDFEPLGEAEVRPGLRHRTVIRCERPAILIGPRLVQTARGTVACPA